MSRSHALLALLVLTLPTAAQAGLDFCNDTDEAVVVAIGYNDNDVWVSEGWWQVEPGDCSTAIGGDLVNRFYYWFAKSETTIWEDERYVFCTTPDVFTIRGDQDCEARGHVTQGFNEIDLEGAVSYVVTLTPATDAAPPPEPKTGGAALLDDVMQPSVEVEMAPSGSFGEPFSITGTFSHCDVLDAGMECRFVNGDWIYTASSADNTPVALLEDLYARGINSRLLFSGDLSGYDGGEARIVLRSFMNAGADEYAETRDAIQGLWTSTEDETYQVMIHGSLYEEWSDGIADAGAYMSFRHGCEGGAGDGIAFRLVSADGLEDRCFFVSELDAEKMELTYAGAGTLLSFRRTR